jgi:geranylgeranyl diphosphate synthase type II
LACALKAGALVADAPKEECDILYSFAERIGLAFQLQDDYLDVYGDASVFGKAIGGDIVCGKKTYLLIKALEMASDADRKLLLSLIQSKDVDADYKVKEVTAIYDKIGVPMYCQAKIEALYAEAKSLWKELPHQESVKENLWQFAISMLGRKS